MSAEHSDKSQLERSRDFITSFPSLGGESIRIRVEEMDFGTAEYALLKVADCFHGSEHIEGFYPEVSEGDREKLKRVHMYLKERLERDCEDAQKLRNMKDSLGPNGTSYYFDLKPSR